MFIIMEEFDGYSKIPWIRNDIAKERDRIEKEQKAKREIRQIIIVYAIVCLQIICWALLIIHLVKK